MALTITIPGAVETTTGSTAPAVLTVGVGAPGQGVPTGGTAGQVLTKIDSTDYNTVFATPSADFITSVTAPLAVGSGVLSVDLSAKANLASPTFTGSPSLPTGTIGITQTALDSTTALATTAFVTTADNLKAALASPTFTGTPTLPTGTIATTQSPGNNTTALATTAFVRADNNVKAWVNFNGTGTVAIRASYNVTSITDNGTSDYTVNFTTALADANYVVNAASSPTTSSGQWRLAIAHGRGTSPFYQAPTTSACRVVWVQNVGTAPDIDNFQCMVSIIR